MTAALVICQAAKHVILISCKFIAVPRTAEAVSNFRNMVIIGKAVVSVACFRDRGHSVAVRIIVVTGSFFILIR